MKIPNFDVVFRFSEPFCYDVTMKSIEILAAYNGSANMKCDSKIVLVSWSLHQSIKNSFL